MNTHHYIPALKYAWLTRFYDPVVAATTNEDTFRQQLLGQATLYPGNQALDLACGTGTFVTMIKAHNPDVTVTGLDADPNILKIARKKAQVSGVDVAFDEGMSFALPYEADKFDVVFSSLFFHHLQCEDKLRTMKEVMRVLKPGGAFHVCDWGSPTNLFRKIMFIVVRLLDGFDVTQDNVNGRLKILIKEAGFCEIKVEGHVETIIGTLDLISAIKPVD